MVPFVTYNMHASTKLFLLALTLSRMLSHNDGLSRMKRATLTESNNVGRTSQIYLQGEHGHYKAKHPRTSR